MMIMEIKEQIKIVTELLDATKELNGEFQEGWNEDISKGEELLKHLKQAQPLPVDEVKESLFEVTYLGKDLRGDIIKSVKVAAETEDYAMATVMELRNSREVYSAIKI